MTTLTQTHSASARRRTRGPRQTLEHAVLIIGAILLMAPMVWFVSIAFRPPEESYELIPGSLTLANFPAMLDRVPAMGRYMLDSTLITGGTVALTCIAASMGGFAFARIRFPGREVIFWFIVSTLFIPITTAIAALYLQMFEMRLLDTRIGLILVYSAWQLAMGLLIMRGIFGAIPKELEESARIDGASMWQVLWRVYAPLARGGIVIVALITFVYAWGEYLIAFTFVGTDVVPMSLAIQFFEPSPSDPGYNFNVAVAAALVMFVPSILIYLVFQRQFSKGIMEGALKG
ncbi:carbohydrate ABC transporter permease [Brachybacterium vulturis]|uniref:carbohydrate ABC transporter permease n=1 Tax=Brachybacterium vulturis TaxID=2017484 RepID=UPI003735747F